MTPADPKQLKKRALNLARMLSEEWGPAHSTAVILRDMVSEMEKRGRAVLHLTQRNHEQSMGCDGCLEVLSVVRAERGEEPECEHGLAMDMHCCACKRSGFFPPDDCPLLHEEAKP